eukprot:TRINITY_DN10967_c0_g1_i1.p1 TRINITY_DN10967_c0_g1~~TRINITY_DN10967_c0_g1_i1.p1  ORF type:complete len:1407 (+),score=393.64 TRINITY_DN10967_c0_g1_i1:182-4402(+)
MFTKLKEWNAHKSGSQESEDAERQGSARLTPRSDGGGAFNRLKQKSASQDSGPSDPYGGQPPKVGSDVPRRERENSISSTGTTGTFQRLKSGNGGNATPSGSSKDGRGGQKIPPEQPGPGGAFTKLKETSSQNNNLLAREDSVNSDASAFQKLKLKSKGQDTFARENTTNSEGMFSRLKQRKGSQSSSVGSAGYGSGSLELDFYNPDMWKTDPSEDDPLYGRFSELQQKKKEGLIHGRQPSKDRAGASDPGEVRARSKTSFADSDSEGESVVLSWEELRAIELEVAQEEGITPGEMLAGKGEQRRRSSVSSSLFSDTVSVGVDGDLANIDMLGTGIDVNHFGMLNLPLNVAVEIQQSWNDFLAIMGSPEAAAETLYVAFYEADSTVQPSFISPRGVLAGKFRSTLDACVKSLHDPPHLKHFVELLGFGHLSQDVTTVRLITFREALVDMFEMEVGENFSDDARGGWIALLNYIGGALVYFKVHYAERLKAIAMCWEQANKDAKEAESQNAKNSIEQSLKNEDDDGQPVKEEDEEQTMNTMVADIPRTYEAMFEFNCALMGFGQSAWMREVVNSFDAIVRNVRNSARFQEECQVLALRISKTTKGNIKLSEYKTCMLATLRALLPKIWEPSFELAWSWLWDSVQRILSKTLSGPPVWEKALMKLVSQWEEGQRYEMRAAMYARFFDMAPEGQDFFKQSNTRMHFMADRVFMLTVELYKMPFRMVEEVSAVGLKHVGYAVPPELVGPYVTAWLEILQDMCKDEVILEAFQWSIGLIARILLRTIEEGSTIVMKAINANSARMIMKAVSVAPRGERALWLLLVEVGSQKISPLIWAIESGSLEAAGAIIRDLLTIRADRERYYYSIDELFQRHPDIIHILSQDAPTLLVTLLEGLIWRSRSVEGGYRRVNFYIRHLLITPDGGVNKAIEWLAASKDVKIIAHPLISFVTDAVWTGVVRKQFILSKLWFLIGLVIFLFSQAVLTKMSVNVDYTLNMPDSRNLRMSILVLRCWTYGCSMPTLFFQHLRSWVKSIKAGHFTSFLFLPLPGYLEDKTNFTSLIVLLCYIGMAASEPLLHCRDEEDWPTEICPETAAYEDIYRICGMTAMLSMWFLIIDMSIFSTKLSAFVLVCGHVLNEVGRFMVALLYILLTFASATCVLNTTHSEYGSLPAAVVTLFGITVGVYEKDYRELDGEPVLLLAIFVFVCISAILLMNLLIAQLNCSYEYVYGDMVGFARMNRARLLVDMLAVCKRSAWDRFVYRLELDKPLEFEQGDMGPSGGLQMMEPQHAHPVLVEQVLRYGGNCSPELAWPEKLDDELEQDMFEKLENMVKRAMAVYFGREETQDEKGPKTHKRGGDRKNKYHNVLSKLDEEQRMMADADDEDDDGEEVDLDDDDKFDADDFDFDDEEEAV